MVKAFSLIKIKIYLLFFCLITFPNPLINNNIISGLDNGIVI